MTLLQTEVIKESKRCDHLYSRFEVAFYSVGKHRVDEFPVQTHADRPAERMVFHIPLITSYRFSAEPLYSVNR